MNWSLSTSRSMIQRRGFALLLALAVLVIASAVMTRLTLMSSDRMLRVIDHEENIQNKWITQSSKLMLTKAPTLLQSQDEDLTGQQFRQFEYSLSEDVTVTMILEDENTKIHPALLKEHFPNASIEEVMQQIAQTHQLFKYKRLNGLSIDQIKAIRTYDQIFEGFDPAYFHESPTDAPQAYHPHPITLWGNQKLNLSKTPTEILVHAAQPHLNAEQVDEIKQRLKDNPDLAISTVFSQVTLTENTQQSLLDRFTTQSSCWRLWVIIDNGRRTFYRLHILDRGSQEQSRFYSFRW